MIRGISGSSVVNRDESRRVPVRILDEYPRDRYEGLAPLVPWPPVLPLLRHRGGPPYQETFSSFRSGVAATTASGAGRLAPFLRGRWLGLFADDRRGRIAQVALG